MAAKAKAKKKPSSKGSVKPKTSATHKLCSTLPTKEMVLLQFVADATKALTPELIERLKKVAFEGEHTAHRLAQLEGRLERLLTPDQKEAAKICGVPYSDYAIECFDLWKERIFAELPAGLTDLATLKRSNNGVKEF